jgi:hypothetical protein
VIASNKKNNDDWGVKGYNMPKCNAFEDKPNVIKIKANNTGNFITQI